MKKIIYSLMTTLLLMASTVASAQEESNAESFDKQAVKEAIQNRLDEGDNLYGVRIEDYDEICYDEAVPDSSRVTGKRKAALRIVDAVKYVFSYMSLDGKRDSIRLSAAVYVRPSKVYNKILLNCHPTVTSTFEAPTGGGPVDEQVKRICDDDFLLVCPDYCGYGFSSYRQHPYLIHDVTARNCVDAEMAALYFAEKNIKAPAVANPPTYIIGYSQGGATALACTKYLESAACPAKIKKAINLKETCCGDGPYSTIATVNKYLEWGRVDDRDLEYPCVLPLIVAAAKDAYADGCMRTVEIENFFSDQFKKTGILEMIKNKAYTTVFLNTQIATKMSKRRPVDVFSANIINPDGTFNTTTNEYKCLIRAMETNELAKGWEPQHPILFYHLEYDGVVPYANWEEVAKETGIQYKMVNGQRVKNNNVKFIDAKTAHSSVPLYVKAGSDMKVFPKFEEINHADGGQYFYGAYMFGDKMYTR